MIDIYLFSSFGNFFFHSAPFYTVSLPILQGVFFTYFSDRDVSIGKEKQTGISEKYAVDSTISFFPRFSWAFQSEKA